MAIDFEIPAEAKAIREKVRQWVHDECIPAEKALDDKPLKEVLDPLRKKARAQGLWCPFIPKEYGGMGLGPLANALVQMELGESALGALSLNTQGPDDASMLTILAHGTEYQKEKFLKPLLNGDKRICFSMTEKAAGADATGMHNIAKAQRALDMATAHVTQRSTFGVKLSDRQAVQFMLADCASELYMARLMLLHIAYKAEKGLDLTQENSIAKVFLAHMVHKVVDTAIQLHGALGYSQDTVLAKWYTQIRSQRLVDGPDEVHKWKVGRNVIKAFKQHGTTASAAGGDLI